jgi:predicted DNA-binding transcriptional regulator AlpA
VHESTIIGRDLSRRARATAPPPVIEHKPPVEGERLLSKAEVCHRVGKTFPTIWQWMQEGKFPRARDNHGVPGWLDSEVSAWIRGLPLKPYKGDEAASEANASPIRAADASVESRRRAAAKTRRTNVRNRSRRKAA